MHAAPLTHGSGHNALAFTMKGCTQVILSSSGFDVDKFLEWVPRYRVNALFMVPTMIKMVIDHPKAQEADLSSLKWVVYGGAPMYAEDLKKAHSLVVSESAVGDGGRRAELTPDAAAGAGHSSIAGEG